MYKELERLKSILSETNPLSADYTTILQRIETILRLRNSESLYKADPSIPSDLRTPVMITPLPPKFEPKEEPKAEPEPPVEEEPKKKSPAKKPKAEEAKTTTLTSEDVRTIIANASANGVEIKPIIQKFVPEGKPIKFSSIPQSAYPDLIKEIEDAN